MTVLVFASVMGVLWLSTVPLTTGIVAQVFGVQYMATLFGIVFLSHQLGSFIGVWLGGVLYERSGNYDAMWWLAIALGVAAAIVPLLIERNIYRPSGAAAIGRACSYIARVVGRGGIPVGVVICAINAVLQRQTR